MKLENLDEGDLVLFNERKQPLEVKDTGEKVRLAGPQGADYLVWAADNGKLLYSQEGKERYASYLRDLRKVGEWVREGDSWKHSDTGKKVDVLKNKNGFWTVKTEPAGLVEAPKYGYTDRDEAIKDAKKFIKKNPEG